MIHEARIEAEERVLILPATRRDGEATCQTLERFGIRCEVCSDPVNLAAQIEVGFGAIVTTDAIASDLRLVAISTALKDQPAWSDAPTILLCRNDRKSVIVEKLAAALTNVTILDRPTSMRTLVSAVRAALRARRRQYQLRDQLSALQRAEEALKTADQRKDEFLAMLAHELRNPLAPIQSASEVLGRIIPPQTAGRSAVDVVKRQVMHLSRLVDDLLDVSRITQGRIQLQKRPLDLHSIVLQAVESVAPLVAQKHHKLTVSSQSGQLFVNGDSARLIQCVTNLLTNAVKYTGEGGEIYLQARPGHANAVIAVSDNGIGIPEELMPRIFGLFVQSARSLDRSEGGLGIGLSVVERLVAMHGGEVTASSPGPGRGSTFEIRLPRIAGLGEPVNADVGARSVSKRVLVVDDNVDAANSITELLRLDGHVVSVAHNAASALQSFVASPPEVVLLDIGLPDLNGYEVALKMPHFGVSVRIVALTGYGQPGDLEKGHQAGFDAHLVKPVDLAVLERVLQGEEPGRLDSQ